MNASFVMVFIGSGMLLAGGLGVLGVVRGARRWGAQGAGAARWGAQVGIAGMCGGVVSASDPILEAMGSRGLSRAMAQSWATPAVMAACVGVGALCAAAACLRAPPGAGATAVPRPSDGAPRNDDGSENARAEVLEAPQAPESAAPWLAVAVLLAMLALADRIQLLDAQLLLLGGLSVIWWRARGDLAHVAAFWCGLMGLLAGIGAGTACMNLDVPLRTAPPIALVALMGALAWVGRARGGATALLGAMLGMGAASMVQALLQLIVWVPALARSELGAALWRAGPEVAGLPFRWGLSSLWPEAGVALLGAGCASVAASSRESRQARRFAILTMLAAGALLVWRGSML